MTNFEKYKDEIEKAIKEIALGRFISDKLKDETYYMSDYLDTYGVVKLFMWLNEEYKEQEVDWSKVSIDTPVVVWSNESKKTYNRYFAGCDCMGKPEVWLDGRTSWTVNSARDRKLWQNIRLAEDGE